MLHPTWALKNPTNQSLKKTIGSSDFKIQVFPNKFILFKRFLYFRFTIIKARIVTHIFYFPST